MFERDTLMKKFSFPLNISGRKGFTIVQFFLAILIISTLTGMSLSHYSKLVKTSRFNSLLNRTLIEIRYVQSLAKTRGGIYGYHWGGDPTLVVQPGSAYRIEKKNDPGCAWQPENHIKPEGNLLLDNPGVITNWSDISQIHKGFTISSVIDSAGPPNELKGIMFNSLGIPVNTCVAVVYPVIINISEGKKIRSIQLESLGRASFK